MANKKNSKTKDKTVMEPAKLEDASDVLVPLDVLRGNCLKLYGVTSSTFAGATAGLDDGEYTLSEIGNKIKAWLSKEV